MVRRMKSINERKWSFLVNRFALAMAICFVWLLVEDAIKIYAREEVVTQTNDISYDAKYWNLIDKFDNVLDDLRITNNELVSNVVLAEQTKINDKYENTMPKDTLVISVPKKTSIEPYGIEVKIENIITGKYVTVILSYSDIISIDVPFGKYKVKDMFIYSWDNKEFTRTNLHIAPFEIGTTNWKK